MSAYLIKPFAWSDMPLIRSWRARPHVVRWWGDAALEYEPEKLADTRIAMWVIELDGRPFAFVQDYDVHGWSPHHFDYLPTGSRGMDLYIGEPDMLGRGHGSGFLRQHVEGLFRRGVPAVGIDPHPDNYTAKRAFETANFTAVSGPVDTRWNRAILMERWA
jgi:aminoglycoside 6'-N-acetyltransferase